jgi:hypothetical protein
MKKLAQIILAIAVLGFGVTANAQQRSIAELREQIRQFEMVNRDVDSSDRVKSINQNFLTARRAELRTLLQYQLDSLRKYQTNYQTHFSAKERQVVANSISSLEREIQTLASLSQRSVASSSLPSRTSIYPLTTTSATASIPSAAQSQVVVIRSDPEALSDATVLDTLDQPNAAIFNPSDAEKIIATAINTLDATGKSVLSVPEPYYKDGKFADDFYCVIHVVRWADPNETTSGAQESVTQTVAAQNWYVYNNGKGKGTGNRQRWSNEDFTSLNRIFGVNKIWLLYIHLNRIVGYDQARYDFNIEKKTPTNVSNLFGVASLFIQFPAGQKVAALGSPPHDIWGGGAVNLDYVPSYVNITANFVKYKTKGPVTAIDKPRKFTNEGRYWWDFSVAVPVKHISETQFDLTGNTVTAKEVNKQNAFALFNLYPVPVDLNGSNYSWIPHFVGGIAIAKQPLKKFLLGAGFGPNFANFYVGAVFTEEKTPSTLKAGDTATTTQLNADLHKHFKPKFSFGFNLPVRGILESLKKETK